MEILHIKDFECRLTANAVVLVVRRVVSTLIQNLKEIHCIFF